MSNSEQPKVDRALYDASIRRYLEARAWFDKAIDERNVAIADSAQWKFVAARRFRVGTAYVIGFCGFSVGFFLGSLLGLTK